MNTINGTPGNDTLTGTSAADFLDGGVGADTMIGLAGNDVYAVDNPLDVVIESAGNGTDRINSTVSYTLGPNIEDLWLVGTLSVSGIGNELDNVMWGNGGDNSLQGLAGNDVLDGGAGADTMIGGTGNDTYWVDNAGDVVTENANEGTDTVYSKSSAYTLPSNVEHLILIAGAGNINGTGNELDNSITGNEGNNILNGMAGNDSLDGGTGADTMSGGTGNDTYWADNSGDVVIENAGEGTDTVISTLANFTLPANVENLTLGNIYSGTENLNGTGNELNNALKGNSGNNVLTGGAGDDTLTGGSGSDKLTGGLGNDVFYISTSDTGTDTITDLSSGDVIEVCGGFTFSGSVGLGSGASVKAGEVQLSTSGGQTTLHIGTDSTQGADLSVVLNGVYDPGNFQLSGFDIRYDTNHAPVLNTTITDQQTAAGNFYTFTLPANMFTDADGDVLTRSAVVVDPDWGYLDLPSWLHFNSATGTFSGTPASGDLGTVTVAVIAADPKGATGSGAFNLTVSPPVVDSTPPTVIISNNVSGVTKGTVNYLLTFSETVTGLSVEDFTVTNGSISSVSGSGRSYTVAVTPSANTEGNMGLTLKANAVFDAASNPNTSSSANPQAIDTLPPTVTNFNSNSSKVTSQAVSYSLSFSEAITGLSSDDFTVTNGTINSVSGSGKSYTVAVTPSANTEGNMGLTLKTNSVIDAASNPNTSSSANPQPIDTLPPTVTNFSSYGSGASGTNYILSFSEAVTGLSTDDFTVTNGAINSVSGSGKSYTVSVTPNANSEENSGLTLKANSVIDVASNPNSSGQRAIFESSNSTTIYCNGLSGTFAGGTGNDIFVIGKGGYILDGGRGTNTLQVTAEAHNISQDTLSHIQVLDMNSQNVAMKISQLYSFQTFLNCAGGITFTDSGSITANSSINSYSLAGGASNTINFPELVGHVSVTGGAGVDTVVLEGPAANYTIKQASNGYRINALQDGNDLNITNVERLEAGGTKVAFDVSGAGHGAESLELLGAAFGKSSLIPAYVGVVIRLFDIGLSLHDVCQMAIGTDLFKVMAGSSSNADFVNLVYKNVVGTLPGRADLDSFVGLLQGSGGTLSQADFLEIAALTETNQIHINLAGLQSTGVIYTELS
ncbi:MAG: Ig-like domain-containing protein [Desulfuromonadales bacterium]